ncbi:MAG: ArsC family reductase [Candidatus Sphingomonas colombiensis]|nr:ArsC family reductase [Sphingomonas sp.]WEK41600.1 MAG: ArsC family reductase [Sphingomonas sp.]
MALTLFGIPNCDTVKKARVWLDQHGVVYAFHDYKKAGVDEAALRGWVARLGWEKLLNRNGTTFRKLPDETKADLDAEKAIAVMLANPSAIRRPVATKGDALVIGFDAAQYETLV